MANYTSYMNSTLQPSVQTTCSDDVDDDVIFLGTGENAEQRNNDELSQKQRNPSVIVLGTPDKERTKCVSVAGSPGQEGFVVTYSRPGDTANYPHPRSACYKLHEHHSSDVCPDHDDVIFLPGTGENAEQRNNISTIDELPKKQRNPSVIILGTPDKERTRCVSVPGSPGQEGFVVTYSRLGDTANYPHPRSACPHHNFRVLYIYINDLVGGPYQQNVAHCDMCYCFACDKPAKECRLWTNPCVAHCNAHYKSSFWQQMRKNLKQL